MTAKDGEMGERVARLETWTETHETRCEDRQVSQGREIREMKEAINGLTKGAWGLAIGLLAWAALQLYGKLDLRPQALPIPAALAPPTVLTR